MHLMLAMLLVAPAGPKQTSPAELQQRCDAGGTGACVELAVALVAGAGVAPRPGQAAHLLRSSCYAGEMSACGLLATLWEEGEGVVAEDAKEADLLHHRACEGGYAPSCVSLALSAILPETFWGADPPTETEKTERARLMSRACDLGEASACLLLSDDDGLGGEAPPTPERAAAHRARALEILQPACEAGDGQACLALAEGPLGPPRTPQGASDLEDRRRAEELFRTACDEGVLGVEGCLSLAAMYIDNEAIEDDVSRAFAPLSKACRGGFCEGCRGLELLDSILRSAGPGGPQLAERIPEILSSVEPCRRRPRAVTDIEDPPLGDEPGSTRIRDRWLAKVNDKWEGLRGRFEAAKVVARMGFPELVAPMLERRDVHETLDRMESVKRRTEHSLRELAHESASGATVPRETAEGCFTAALREVREPEDARDRPLRLGLHPNEESGRPGRLSWDIEVLSDGPDMKPATEDDISTLEPYGAYDARHYADMDPGPGDTPPGRGDGGGSRCRY